MISLPVILPEGFLTNVKKGDSVAQGQIIASKNTITQIKINIPNGLSVNLSKAKKCIRKVPGERVEIGEIVAAKKSFFGGNILLRSREAGTVLRYEQESGDLVIALVSSQNSNVKNIISPVDGVVKLCDNKEIVIATDKNVIQVEFALGNNVQGEVLFLSEDDSYHVNAEAIGRIIISRVLSREMILKGIGIGVVGFIGVEISDFDFEYFIQKKVKIPVARIDLGTYEKLKGDNTKNIFINPKSKSIILTNL